MSPRTIRRCLLTALLALLASSGAEARAGELPAEVRRWAERAFLEGRLEDLDTVLAGAKTASDRLPLHVRDTWWRRLPADTAVAERPAADDALVRRRHEWLAAPAPRGPYPRADDGGEDPYPILTALIEDRARRETHGALGLPLEGPLEALATAGDLHPVREERAIYFLGEWTRWLMSASYRGPPPDADQLAGARFAEDLRVRNGWWALVALGVFFAAILAMAFGIRRLARPVESPEEA